MYLIPRSTLLYNLCLKYGDEMMMAFLNYVCKTDGSHISWTMFFLGHFWRRFKTRYFCGDWIEERDRIMTMLYCEYDPHTAGYIEDFIEAL